MPYMAVKRCHSWLVDGMPCKACESNAINGFHIYFNGHGGLQCHNGNPTPSPTLPDVLFALSLLEDMPFVWLWYTHLVPLFLAFMAAWIVLVFLTFMVFMAFTSLVLDLALVTVYFFLASSMAISWMCLGMSLVSIWPLDFRMVEIHGLLHWVHLANL